MENEFNIQNARQAWKALLEKFSGLQKIEKPTKIPSKSVFSEFEKTILNQSCPKACLVAGADKTYYIPANFLKEMISDLFEDRWNTEILSQDIICRDLTSLNFQNGQPEIHVQRLIGQVSLKLTIFSKDRAVQQSHTSLGLMGGDQKPNSAQYMKLYRVAIKGAETNALRTCLSKFGKIFTTYEEEDYQNLKDHLEFKKEIPQTKKISKTLKFYPLVSAETLIILETSSPQEWIEAYQNLINKNKDNIITFDKILTNNKKILTEVKREMRKLKKEEDISKQENQKSKENLEQKNLSKEDSSDKTEKIENSIPQNKETSDIIEDVLPF